MSPITETRAVSSKGFMRLAFRLGLLIALALALIIQPCLPIIHAQASSSDAHEKIIEAFASMQEADNAGGDVSHLANKLNEALDLISQGDSIASSNSSRAQELYQQAEDIANKVILEAPLVQEEGILAQQNSNIMLRVELAVLAVLGFIVYRFGPKLLWRLWLRAHSDWKVRIK
ncbi:MAG: hypothetical protein H3Z53_08720 [archaeon]|nr:hypothetical protein [archaeon]MCP8314435.1 hypothetical protein [archaeon]MCP8319359.1 hypothetical protein [archaeon]